MSQEDDPIGDLTAVERATLQLVGREGRGILVPGWFALTAAHCIDWSAAAGKPLAGHSLQKARAQDGRELHLRVLAIEPVADIAVLGSPDSQEAPSAAAQFEKFVVQTEPVPLSYSSLKPYGRSRPASVLGHDRRWITGGVKAIREQQASVVFETEEWVGSGVSGGPIVTLAGKLIAVVSHASEPDARHGDRCRGSCARPIFSLPVWVLEAIRASQKRDDEQ